MSYEEFLIEKYQKSTLTKEELAKELNLSVRTITDKARECSAEIPPFKKIGKALLFPIKGVAKFLENDFVRVM